MRKRLIAALLAACMILALAGCTSSEDRAARREALEILDGRGPSYALDTGTSIESQEIYNNGQIRVVLAGIQGDPQRPELVLAIHNGSRKEIRFSPQSFGVNGWTLSCYCDTYRISGHSVTTAVVESYGALALANVSDVAEVAFSYRIMDNDYNALVEDTVTVTTDTQNADTSSTPDCYTILDNGSFKVGLYLQATRYDSYLCTYVEDNASYDAYVEIDDVYLNGEELSVLSYLYVASGFRAIGSESMYYAEDYEDVTIQPEDQLTLSLVIDPADYNHPSSQVQVSLTGADLLMNQQTASE